MLILNHFEEMFRILAPSKTSVFFSIKNKL